MTIGEEPLKIWVTGAGGFLGKHFTRFFKIKGHRVFSDHIDLAERAALEKCAASMNWDVVLHLAGISSVAECDKDPALARRVNVEGTQNLAAAVAKHCPSATLLFASTAQVYQGAEGAEVQAGVTFTESRKIAPQNFYAQTKWEAEQALRQFRGLHTLVLRFFNYTHKSQPAVAFVPHLYSVLKTGTKEVPVGNLYVERDIGALPDLLWAVEALIAHRHKIPSHEPINVCSGVPKLLQDLASKLATRMNSDANFVVDPKRVRPNEAHRIAGSHERLSKYTGWAPRFRTIDELIEAFLLEESDLQKEDFMTKTPKYGIVIPTYNEQDGIAQLLQDLRTYNPEAAIIVVDDSKGTATVDAARAANVSNVVITHRKTKGGRGTAVVDGIKHMLAQGIEYVVEMDADFSHPPKQIPDLIAEARKRSLDVLIASRYTTGGKIENWPLTRRMLSKATNLVATTLLRVPVKDYTSGFRVYSRRAAEILAEHGGKKATGFIALSEFLVALYYRGFNVGETPTVFTNRIRGESSMDLTEMRNAFNGMIQIYGLARELKGQIKSQKSEGSVSRARS
jgi:dolichol-phosphate mannosyltransferase